MELPKKFREAIDAAASTLCHCGRLQLDHTFREAIACGILKVEPLSSDAPPSDEPALDLRCGRCGKKKHDHTLNEFWNTDDHHTYRNAL